MIDRRSLGEAKRLGLILEALRVTVAGRPRGDGRELCETHCEAIRKLLDRRIRLTKVRKLLLRQGIDIRYPTRSRRNSDFNFARPHVLACVIAVLKYLVEPPAHMILGRMFR